MPRLDPETLLSAYAQGVFPMADRDGRIRFYTADPRGVIPLSPLEAFHVPQTLRQVVRQGRFDVRVNSDFAATMRGCMRNRDGGSWISEELIAAYVRLHELGFAHSVESWQEGQLVGGLYGVSLGGAFFGESMFHRRTDASKVALAILVEKLKSWNFHFIDSQMTTEHMLSLGAKEISRRIFVKRLQSALRHSTRRGKWRVED